MASDAFFPFPDCVEIAGKAGITVSSARRVNQRPTFHRLLNENDLSMVFTGTRHFKH